MPFIPAHKALPPSLCPPMGVNEGPSSVMTPGPSGPWAGIPVERPLTFLYLELLKDGCKTQVQSRPEYVINALVFSAALKRLVFKVQLFEQVVYFQQLMRSIQGLSSIYLSSLVFNAHNGVASSPRGLTGLFECLDDFGVYAARCDSLHKSGFHAAALSGYVRLFRYLPKYLRRELVHLACA